MDKLFAVLLKIFQSEFSVLTLFLNWGFLQERAQLIIHE